MAMLYSAVLCCIILEVAHILFKKVDLTPRLAILYYTQPYSRDIPLHKSQVYISGDKQRNVQHEPERACILTGPQPNCA